jgi:signal transduction histidine kinase
MTADNIPQVENEQEAWQIQVARFALLSEVVLLIARTPDLNRLLTQAINKLKWVIDFERCTLALRNDDNQTYHLQTLLETRRSVPKVMVEAVPLEHDLAGEVIRRRQMRLITNLTAAISDFSPLADPAMADGSLASALSLPLQAYGKVLGAITFSTVRSEGYNDGDIKVATSFATHLALAIDRWQQTQQLQQANEYLAALHDTSLGMISRLDLNELLSALITRAAQLLDTSHGYIYLVESGPDGTEGAFIQPKVGLGVFGQSFSLRLQSGEGLAGKVWQTGRPLVIDDYDAWPERSPNFDRNLIRAIMGVPLKSGPEVIGVISIAYSRESQRKFGEEEVELLTRFAQLASIALDNARLFEKTQQANNELSRALENLRTAQSQLVEAEKMAALGGLVAGVAHEINTPVGVSVTAASLLEDKTAAFRKTYQGGQMKRSDLEKYLDTAEQSSQMLLRNLNRAAELIQSFKQVAVDQSSEERREFRVKQYLEEILLSLRPHLKKTQHSIHINGDERLTLDSYPGAFAQIVTNLVMNSLLHAYEQDDAGQLTFTFEQSNNRFTLEYIDDGRGISKENLSRIFDPFFTTKRNQGGSGLGLHIIYNLVTQKLGGTIHCQSEEGAGTKFIIGLPMTLLKKLKNEPQRRKGR